MPDNQTWWDEWLEEEARRSRRRSVWELHSEGLAFYKQSDYRQAAERFCQAAKLAEEQRDADGQCENLSWEGNCWYYLGKLKLALHRLMRAEALGGGDAGVRFRIVNNLFRVANVYPLPREDQEELLKKLAPYKDSGQIGGSKSAVLSAEGSLLRTRGDWSGALDRAQEAFVSQVHRYPIYNDSLYYRELLRCYRMNGLLPEAWNTLRDWRAHGSTTFADTKSWQYRAEAQLLYAEGRSGAAWDAIRRCQAEERYLNIYGQGGTTETLTWLIRIGVDLGRLNEAREVLPLLLQFRNDESLFLQYDCFYWSAYYYAGLAARVWTGGDTARWDDKQKIAKTRAMRWYLRAEVAGRELDRLLETDEKRKELDNLRAKLSEAGILEEQT